MKKRMGESLLFLTVLMLPAVLFTCRQFEDRSHRLPNILFVSFDDLRPELGCYGNEVIQTPHIDRFAENGVVFTRTYCQASACAPSRASYMTGLRPDSIRTWHLGDKFRKINPDIKTLPQHLHDYGYYTVSMGKIFHNNMPDSVSFDEPDLRPEEYKTPGMVDRDAESFYNDEGLKRELARVREERLKKNPNAYAGGWAYGRVVECSEAPDEAFYDGAQTTLVLETMRRLRDKSQPFFLALGYFRPHLPFVAPKKYWDLYDRASIPLASNPFLPENAPVMAMNSTYELAGCYDLEYVKHPSIFQLSEDTARLLKHGYYASVSYVDACFGRLIDGLNELGLSENTIVVILGDHGWKLGEHGSWCKQTNYDNDTRVPLIIKVPGNKGKGIVCHRLTELVDLFPTLLDLAGIEVPEYLQGTSLKPLLNNPEREWKSAVFSQFHRRPRISPDGKRYMGYSMTTSRYHYVEWYFWDNNNKEPGELAAIELYDHLTDPQENTNIVVEEKNRELVNQLSEQLSNGWRAAKPPQTIE